MQGRPLLVASLLLAPMALLAPAANAAHCETGLHVFARSSLGAPPAPPHLSNAPGACPRTFGLADTHVLPSFADQIFVRCHCGMSPSVRSTLVQLDGLGWEGNLFTLYRVERATGPSYEFQEWIYLPELAAAEGTLTVTFRQPGHWAVVQYWKDAAPV